MVLALGVGAFASGPRTPIPVVAAPLALPSTGPAMTDREPLARTAGKTAVAIIYTRQAPPAGPAAAAIARPVARVAPAARHPAATVPPAVRPAARPAGSGNGFAYGYCTWWVAHKRYVPWRGNAAAWWWNARAFGFSEGARPRAGAIMVMGISRSSPVGHVAYVERVNGDGSFVVSEMNWWGVPGGGWNRVDYRTVRSLRGVLGFIY
jgi:surface antigen